MPIECINEEHALQKLDKRARMNIKQKYRYATDTVGWLFHDAVIHPITGVVGLVGKLTGSIRIMALGHHIHNISAPSQDALADYIEASAAACRNETRWNPTGSRTPDEGEINERVAERILGRKRRPGEDPTAEQIIEDGGLRPLDSYKNRLSYTGNGDGVTAEQFLKEASDPALREARAASETLAALENKKFSRWYKNMRDDEGNVYPYEDEKDKAAFRAYWVNHIEAARERLAKANSALEGTSLHELITPTHDGPKPKHKDIEDYKKRIRVGHLKVTTLK